MTTNSNGSKSAAGVDWIVDSPDVVHLEGRSQPRYMQHPWTERPIGPLTGLFGDATIISESEQYDNLYDLFCTCSSSDHTLML